MCLLSLDKREMSMYECTRLCTNVSGFDYKVTAQVSVCVCDDMPGVACVCVCPAQSCCPPWRCTSLRYSHTSEVSSAQTTAFATPLRTALCPLLC